MRRRMLLQLLPGALLVGAPMPAVQVQDVGSPAGPDSGQCWLAPLPDGSVGLSWLEPKPEPALLWARWDGKQWSAPRTVVRAGDLLLNWADFPSLCPLSEGRMAAHWLVRHPVKEFATSLRIGYSRDGGRTWRTVFQAGADLKDDYSGFVSLVPLKDGFGAVYLSPPTDAPPTAGHGDHEGHRKTLRFVQFDAGGKTVSDQEIDSDVCSCCQTSVVATDDGLLAAYRDHTGELRDVALLRNISGAREAGQRWTAPQALHRDEWRINACPVNGPALAAAGQRVAAAWFTGAQDRPRVQLAFSHDGGQRFGPPAALDSGQPVGRVAVVLLPDHSAIASWIEKSRGGTHVCLRRVSPAGQAGPIVTVAEVPAGRTGGFPRLVACRGQLIVAWRTDRVHTGLLPVPPLA